MSTNLINQFKSQHLCVIPAGFNQSEVELLNSAIDRSTMQFPELWYGKERKQSVQCLLTEPGFDFALRHHSYLPLLREVFGDKLCFSEFSAMVRAGGHSGPAVEGWHRDFAPDPTGPMNIRAISVIIYLTEVDSQTARFCCVPGSANRETPPVLVDKEQDRYEAELDVVGGPGTVIVTDASNWHCAKWGKGPRERRTIHLYFQSSGIAPVSNHASASIIPRRLWDSPDPQVRRFYSHHNAITRAVALDYAK